MMNHPKEPGGATSADSVDARWTSSARGREWEADTDVMPPEYCRQLLEISRQLQRGK
jgi:hypothetical protein